MKLKNLLKEWVLEGMSLVDIEETEYHTLNELKIDPLHSYEYKEINPTTYSFKDRCGNQIIALYTKSIGEFKTGYKLEGIDPLIFKPEDLKGIEDYEGKIAVCPDEKKLGTVYNILIKEIIPKYLLNKSPNKLFFNPVSDSRTKLVNIIISKVIKEFPQLKQKDNYIVYI